MGGEVGEYQAVIDKADGEASQGRYKEAYNTLARALWLGGPCDQEIRRRRGLYAYQVARGRLDGLDSSPRPKQTLIKAGCWLARSEAYLSSAAEGGAATPAGAIQEELDRTREEQERFRALVRRLGQNLFVD